MSMHPQHNKVFFSLSSINRSGFLLTLIKLIWQKNWWDEINQSAMRLRQDCVASEFHTLKKLSHTNSNGIGPGVRNINAIFATALSLSGARMALATAKATTSSSLYCSDRRGKGGGSIF